MRSLVPPGRLVGLDVARCLALLGMIATHTLQSTAPDGGVTTVQAIAGGRSSALFAVLAGVSMALMSGRTTPLTGSARQGVAAGLLVRALAIAVIGLGLGSLDTTIAVILTSYGVLFCLGVPFLRLRAPALAGLAVTWAVVGPVLSHLLRPHLPPPSYASPGLESLDTPLQLISELLFTGFYPAFVWLAYLLAGMAVGRLGLEVPRTSAWLAVLGAGTAVLSLVVSDLLLAREGVQQALERTFTGPGRPGGLTDTLEHGTYGTTPTGSWWWLTVHAPHSGTPFDLLHTGGSALMVIGLCLLVVRVAPRTSAVVFGAGAMTLTLYTLHVVMRTPQAWPEDSVETFGRHVLLVLAIGAAYRLARRSGPLERLVALLADAYRKAATGPPPSPREPAASGQDGGQH